MRHASSRLRRSLRPALVLIVLELLPRLAAAQDLVPGAYTPAPVGFNVLTFGATINRGDMSFDPSLPVEDGHATIGLGAATVARTMNVGGRFASLGAAFPFMSGHLNGVVLGTYQEAERLGFGDMLVRAAINLYGAGAMTRQEFASYRPSTLVGVSLTTGIPIGQYDSAKYINLGTNRWSFKPEVGVSRTRNRWTLEGSLGVAFFTDNGNYVGAVREQAPIVAVQGHVIRTIRPGYWLAVDANFWKGGLISTNGVDQSEDQQNSRVGATLAVPIQRQQVRISYSFGAFTRLGGDFHQLGVSYSYVWATRARP
jgi:hypothetical protein